MLQGAPEHVNEWIRELQSNVDSGRLVVYVCDDTEEVKTGQRPELERYLEQHEAKGQCVLLRMDEWVDDMTRLREQCDMYAQEDCLLYVNEFNVDLVFMFLLGHLTRQLDVSMMGHLSYAHEATVYYQLCTWFQYVFRSSSFHRSVCLSIASMWPPVRPLFIERAHDNPYGYTQKMCLCPGRSGRSTSPSFVSDVQCFDAEPPPPTKKPSTLQSTLARWFDRKRPHATI